MSEKLEQTLWRIADTLRGKMDADDFRDYILGFIFYKYLSEKMEDHANKILKPDKLTYADLKKHKEKRLYLKEVKADALDALGYFLEPDELFSELAERGNAEGKNNFILDDLAKILNHIEQSTMGTASEEEFGNLFEDLDLTSSKLGKSENAKNELIVKILNQLNEIDFDLHNAESDVLGDAYEYLIGKFASGAGKKAGEFYTPQQVSTVLAKLVTVGKTKLKNVYDPTCGSGSLLLRVAREVKEKNVGKFYGQESNPTTYNLCRMNMIMHNVHYSKFDIKNEDTLERPQHADLRFEAIVANPPFSAEWSASPLFMSDDRFAAYGKLAPRSTADFAFVQHMIHQLDDRGTMACVLPHGVLFRGGAEGHIREYLIREKNYLDAVIGLPANIFYGTGIPTCIIVVKKKREHNDNVLFIDASQHFEKVKNQNVLRPQDIDKIVNTYKTRSSSDKYSYAAKLSRIAENEYNLNIPRYVSPFHDEVEINLKYIEDSFKISNQYLFAAEKTIESFCKELNISPPNGYNISLLQDYKRGVMQKLLSGKLRFKDEKGKDYPKWNEKLFGDIFSFYSTNSFSRDNLNYDQGTVKNIHYGDIHTKFSTLFDIRREHVPFINSEIDLSKIKRENYCQDGDLVIADASEDYEDIGKTIEIVSLNGEKLLAGLHTFLARPDKYQMQTGFSAYLVKAAYVRKQVMTIAQGTKVLSLSSGRLAKVKLNVPSIKEQEKIASYLSAIDDKITSIVSHR